MKGHGNETMCRDSLDMRMKRDSHISGGPNVWKGGRGDNNWWLHAENTLVPLYKGGG